MTIYEMIFDYIFIDDVYVPIIICFSERSPVRILLLTIQNGKFLRTLGNIFPLQGVDLGTGFTEKDIKLKASFSSPKKVQIAKSKKLQDSPMTDSDCEITEGGILDQIAEEEIFIDVEGYEGAVNNLI